jgi:hypothetical protein
VGPSPLSVGLVDPRNSQLVLMRCYTNHQGGTKSSSLVAGTTRQRQSRSLWTKPEEQGVCNVRGEEQFLSRQSWINHPAL